MQQVATPKILPSAPKGYRPFFSQTNKKDIFRALLHDPNINKHSLYTVLNLHTFPLILTRTISLIIKALFICGSFPFITQTL